jgi:hypothetical protein
MANFLRQSRAVGLALDQVQAQHQGPCPGLARRAAMVFTATVFSAKRGSTHSRQVALAKRDPHKEECR